MRCVAIKATASRPKRRSDPLVLYLEERVEHGEGGAEGQAGESGAQEAHEAAGARR